MNVFMSAELASSCAPGSEMISLPRIRSDGSLLIYASFLESVQRTTTGLRPLQRRRLSTLGACHARNMIQSLFPAVQNHSACFVAGRPSPAFRVCGAPDF
jgi:hypothetical protein